MQVPILLVHGITNSGTVFSKLQPYLKQRGVAVVETMDIIPPDASLTIAMMAAQLAVAVQALQQQTQAAQVDIVGYSMGGLVTRYYIQRMSDKKNVRRFVSLAGPHAGTVWACLCGKPGCREMRRNSALLQGLAADPDPWGTVQVFSFWTPYDGMIVPARSSVLPKATNRQLNILVHSNMLRHPLALAAVADVLLND
jgi:triacylglycerol lipase